MDKKEVLNRLYQLPHLHPKNDLSYVKRALQALGNPQDRYRTVHVTGTNGKGSTCYYLRALLQQAGQKTGLFVSPYVVDFNERIQINGQLISNQLLVLAFQSVNKAVLTLQAQQADFSLTTFEFETCMAFWAFAHEQCDYAVIEVGIGGEHDKTNVIKPAVSVITTVGLDHEQLIGPTLADIAREKSGVIKAGRPVVLGNVPQSVLGILKAKAAKLQAPVIRYQQDFQAAGFLPKPLVERIDAGCALAALAQLPVKLSWGQQKRAILQTAIPGRYQILGRQPLVIADGAHNIQAMQHLLAWVRQMPHARIRVVLGMMKDKDLDQVLHLFRPAEQIMLTRIDYPRAAKLTDFPSWAQRRFSYEPRYRQAVSQVWRQSQPNDIVLITGSFYLVGAVLADKEFKQ